MSGTYDTNASHDHEASDETLHARDTRDAEGTDQTSYAVGGAETIRHEERLATGTETHEVGKIRVRKHVESHPVEYSVPREVEHVDASERVSVPEGDSGEVEVLDDGSVSIPIFEEVLVVTKRLVVRERVIVRKHTVVDEHTLQTELRREHVSVDADDSIELTDNRPTSSTTSTTTSTSTSTSDVDGDGDPDGPSETDGRHLRTDHEDRDRI